MPGTAPSRQFSLKYSGLEGVGKGKKRPRYVELSHAVLLGLGAAEWSLVILLTRHFLCVLILRLFKSNSSTSLLCKKISAFLMCCRNRCYFKYLPEMNPIFFCSPLGQWIHGEKCLCYNQDFDWVSICGYLRICSCFSLACCRDSTGAMFELGTGVEGEKGSTSLPCLLGCFLSGQCKKKSTVLFFLFHDQGQRMQENYPRVRKKKWSFSVASGIQDTCLSHQRESN